MKRANLKYKFPLSKSSSKNAWKALAILIVGLVLTASFAFFTERNVKAGFKAEFSLVCNEIKTTISDRLHAHAQLLRCGSSLFAASDTVTRKGWELYIKRAKIDENLHGIQGVGYSVIIPENQLQQHISNIRKEGFSDFTVKPFSGRAVYTSIIYLEPFEGRNLRAFGYDMYSEPIRRKAMEQARDFDVAALSGKVILVQETNKDLQAGALMYVPVYRNGKSTNTVEERRAAIIGWVYSPYRMNDLMNGILGHWDSTESRRIRLQIYDNDSISANSLLFDSQREGALFHNNLLKRVLTLPVVFNGKKWTLCFLQSEEQLFFYDNKVIIILLSGILISFLLFGLILSLIVTQTRAIQIAGQLTSELKESEEKHRHLIENSHDIIYTLTPDGVFMFVSPAWTALLGHPVNQVSGQPFQQFVHPDDLPACFEFFQKVIGTGKRQEGVEHRVQHIDGTWHWYTSSAVPLRDETGKVIGFEGTARDITEGKIAREEINHKNEELLILNAEKDKFFSIIAHDLRSPFNVFLGFTRLMVENLPTLKLDQIQEISMSMRNSAIKLFNLLENLLEWSQMQRGLCGFNPQSFILLSGVSPVIELVREAADKKMIRISDEVPEDLMVTADIQMFDSILRNLVFNAVKFTHKSGKVIIYAKPVPGNFVEISIRDTGIGMSRSMIDNLFRFDVKTNRNGTEGEPSTGLGLIICKDFIEKHGGRIWAESEEGKGSIFRFILPSNLIQQPGDPQKVNI